jgi:hypothetical protein
MVTEVGRGARQRSEARESLQWAYDRDSKIGHLDKALDEAGRGGWTVVSMKGDWRQAFAFEKP